MALSGSATSGRRCELLHHAGAQGIFWTPVETIRWEDDLLFVRNWWACLFREYPLFKGKGIRPRETMTECWSWHRSCEKPTPLDSFLFVCFCHALKIRMPGKNGILMPVQIQKEQWQKFKKMGPRSRPAVPWSVFSPQSQRFASC